MIIKGFRYTGGATFKNLFLLCCLDYVNPIHSGDFPRDSQTYPLRMCLRWGEGEMAHNATTHWGQREIVMGGVSGLEKEEWFSMHLKGVYAWRCVTIPIPG